MPVASCRAVRLRCSEAADCLPRLLWLYLLQLLWPCLPRLLWLYLLQLLWLCLLIRLHNAQGPLLCISPPSP